MNNLKPSRVNVGIGYRRGVADLFFDTANDIKCLEILVDHFVPFTDVRRRELARLKARFHLVPHCLSLNLGSTSTDLERWSQIKLVIEAIEPSYLSDHASVCGNNSVDLGHLSPIWRTEANLLALVRNLDRAQNYFRMPIVIETITESFKIPDADYDWDDFLVEACRRSGAGLLVDITNLWINFGNNVWQRKADFFGSLPEARWYQWHIVGYGRDAAGKFVDSHENPITPDLYAMLEHAASLQLADTCIIERDGRLGDLDEAIAEVAQVSSILAKYSTHKR